MKRFFTFLYVLLSVGYSLGQSCLSDGITFTTQEQIDSFAINYPGCTEILGDVVIGSTQFNYSITNLEGLSAVKGIKGNLQIRFIVELQNLMGLDSLIIIEGALTIQANVALNDISALANIDHNLITGLSIIQNPYLSTCNYSFICNYMENGGTLEILNVGDCEQNRIHQWCGIPSVCPPYNIWFRSQAEIDSFPIFYPECSKLTAGLRITESTSSSIYTITDLSPFSQLTELESYIWIVENDNLINLNGLHNLTQIGGSLSIQYNQQLESLEGLQSLNYIGGGLNIVVQDSISNYNGLENLETLGGRLYIYDNDKLSDLTALSNLTSAINGVLYVSGNNSLQSLEGLHNIDLSNVTNLVMHHNYALWGCYFENICQYIENGGQTYIDNNGYSCKDSLTILENCLVLK